MIEKWFLIASLFIPRISLLIAYLSTPSQIPLNNVPYWGDAVMAVFIPRFLIVIYIYSNLGTDNGWFWAHFILALVLYFFGGRSSSNND